MATITAGSIANGTDFVLAKGSATLAVETRANTQLIKALDMVGAININSDLNKQAGDTLKLYNLLSANGKGNVGDVDLYDLAETAEYGSRSLVLDRISKSFRVKKEGSKLQQISEVNLMQGIQKNLSKYFGDLAIYSILNHLGGNSATAIYATSLDSAVYDSTTVTQITGFNTVVAPTSNYKAYGSNLQTSDTSVGGDASSVLSIKDFQRAREVITQKYAGIPMWNLIQGRSFQALAIISETGLNQLKQEAVAQGQGITYTQTLYAMLSGGKSGFGAVNGVLGSFEMEGFLFIVLPDHLMPRGVNSTSPVANTRRAIIVGANALDVVYGKGFSAGGMSDEQFIGFEIGTDDTYKRANKEAYFWAAQTWGCKKIQVTGNGGNESTAYDVGTYVITHYSRT